MRCCQSRQLSIVEEGEYLQVMDDIRIGAVTPELIETVGRGLMLIKPDSITHAFAEFGAVRIGNQRVGNGVGLTAVHASNKIHTTGNVAPLVTATHLNGAVITLIEDHKVVRLQDHVTEFGVTDAL